MLLFLFALVLAGLGIGAYAHYNTGVHDITLRGYVIPGVPDWGPAAAVAGVVLFLFLVQAIWAGIRIRMLKQRARGRLGPVGSSQTARASSR
jgi:hypothetical protein